MLLRKILREKGIKLPELSKLTGINYHTLQKYSSGNRSLTVENAKKIGKVLGIEWWKFFDEKINK